MPRSLLAPCALAIGLLLAGCGTTLRDADSLFGLVTPYRFEIVQGNVVTKEQLERVRIGMPRAQVRDLLGSPLVADPFRADRWDYVFTIRRQGAEPQRRSVIVFFEGDRLVKIDAEELPTEQDFVASISRHREFAPRKLELSEEERAALPRPPAAAAAAAAEPVGPVRSYPPLEGS
jgi:outer membrane protein assembly factor BamE